MERVGGEVAVLVVPPTQQSAQQWSKELVLTSSPAMNNASAAATIRIELPGLPSTVNARMHWSKKDRERKHWFRMVWLATANKRPTVPYSKAHIKFTRHSSVPIDSDNLAGSFKFVQDALITAKIIENDQFKNIGYPDYTWEKAAPKQGRITIEIMPL